MQGAAALAALLLGACGEGVQGTPTELIKAVVVQAAPDGRCAGGGQLLRLGLDQNGNQVLDTPEASHQLRLCPPTARAEDGAAPVSAWVRISSAGASAECPAGGALVEARYDIGNSPRPNPRDRSLSLWCNSAFPQPPGRLLAGGTAAGEGGATVASAELALLLRVEGVAEAGPCREGTLRVLTGLDVNRNGLLDEAEVRNTQLLCAHSPGPLDHEIVTTLPDSAPIGHIVQLGGGADGRSWRIEQAVGQRINTEQLRGVWGGNWAPTGPKARWRALAQSDDGRRLLAAGDDVLLRSTDSGHSWVPVGPTQGLRWTGVASSADGRRLVATSISDALYTSTDGGQQWSRRSLGLGWGAVAASADGLTLVAVRHGQQLLVSHDGASRWSRRAPRADWAAVAASANGQVLAAVPRGGRLHLSRDGGQTWQVKGPAADHTGVAVSADGSRVMVSARNGKPTLRWTDDHGDTWQAPGQPGLDDTPLDAVALSANGSTLASATQGGMLWSSSDGGQRWTAEHATHRIAAMGITAEGLARVALARDDKIYRAAAATTPGSPGALNLRPASPVSLRYLGTGIWAVVGATGGFYVQ
ncbi:MAG: hypothetical protein JNJ71_15205 [Rubrivivax sp.]|nr:hypothetical protein [Rubrivivax sp.]